jgi:hypothetical protein
MTTPNQPAAGKTAADRTDGAVIAEPAPDRLPQRPIVYEVRKARRGRRGRKRKTSRALREPQRQERSATRAAERVARAIADGFGEYRKRRDRSAERKRDGAIKDAVRNFGRGLEEAIRRSAKAPTDLTRRVSGKRLARMVVLPPPFGFLR